MKVLEGKTIVLATFSEGNIYLETDDGTYKLQPVGECCAVCYIEHVSGSDAMSPGAVIWEVEDIESPVPIIDADDSYGDVIEAWGHLFKTSKGYCSLEMRLQHNGYYGGSLEVRKVDGPGLGMQLDDF